MDNRVQQIEKPLRFLKRICLDEERFPVGGNAMVLSAVDRLLIGSTEYGLLPDEINDLVQVIVSKVLKDNKRKLLIKCLLPSSYVPVNAVLRCFSWMNTDKASNQIKAMLLCWIVAVLEQLEDFGPVLLLYDAVCFWMNSDALRQHASVLLTLITRKEDVRLYRVQRFIRLKSALGVDAHLNSVLSLYKDYCPHLIPTPIRCSLKGVSPRPYLFWMNHVKTIQARNQEVGRPIFNTNQNSRVFWDAQKDAVLKKPEIGKKRKLTAVFPEIKEVVVPLSYSDRDSEGNDLVPLHNITSFDALLDNITRLEMPNQAILVLKYPVIRHIISCYKNFDYLMRFKYRVHWILLDDLIWGLSREKTDTELFLLKFMQFCEYLQEGHPDVEPFLGQYLAYFWNGYDFSKLMLSFITRLRLRSIDELTRILGPLKQIFNSSLLRFKFDALNALTKLLSNMIYVEYVRCLKIQKIAAASSLPVSISNCLYLFDDETLDFDPVYTIVYLIEFVNELYIRSLVMENGSTFLLHSAFSFYQLTLKLVEDYDIPFVLCPPPIVVYSALFSSDGVAVTRLCGVLMKCTNAVFKLKHLVRYQQHYPDLIDKSNDQIKLLNNYVVDVINSLWRDKAFDVNNQQDSIFDFLKSLSDDLDIPKINSTFSVGKHLGLIGHALTFSKMVAPSTTDFRFTPHKMNKNQKKAYLDYLQSEGYGNIASLIQRFLKL